MFMCNPALLFIKNKVAKETAGYADVRNNKYYWGSTCKHKNKNSKWFIHTIIDSVNLVNETLIGELCGQRGEQVNVTIKEK